MAENEKETFQEDQELKEKMAVEFPDWDLLPPAVLVKRHKSDEQTK